MSSVQCLVLVLAWRIINNKDDDILMHVTAITLQYPGYHVNIAHLHRAGNLRQIILTNHRIKLRSL